MWERFEYTLEDFGKPTFQDFKKAAGFNDVDVRDYFRKKAKGAVEGDEIKESFTKEEWSCRIHTVFGTSLDSEITHK
jgi:hypothetical protein